MRRIKLVFLVACLFCSACATAPKATADEDASAQKTSEQDDEIEDEIIPTVWGPMTEAQLLAAVEKGDTPRANQAVEEFQASIAEPPVKPGSASTAPIRMS